MHKTILREKNILTVPREIAEQMRLAEGDEFIVTEQQGRVAEAGVDRLAGTAPCTRPRKSSSRPWNK